MTEAVARKVAEIGAEVSVRPEANLPMFVALDATTIAVRANGIFLVAGKQLSYRPDPIAQAATLEPGRDYAIVLNEADQLLVVEWAGDEARPVLGGFHHGLGGNAAARAGSDSVPAINPLSIWDVGFRPTCGDPRGMAYVAGVPGSAHVSPFWIDLYLLGVDHLKNGTSCAGVEIADGYKHGPKQTDGKRTKDLNFATAKGILEHHGKQLPTLAEFFAAAYGVTEKTSADTKPELTGLDAARTSRCGMIQATGNLYVWGTDGDPDEPRASIFGGGWNSGDNAGSRCAIVGSWPDYSDEWLGARGRSDHLQLG